MDLGVKQRGVRATPLFSSGSPCGKGKRERGGQCKCVVKRLRSVLDGLNVRYLRYLKADVQKPVGGLDMGVQSLGRG